MARLTVSTHNVTTTRDLRRYLDLLDGLGFATESEHPVQIDLTGAISASASLSVICGDDEGEDD